MKRIFWGELILFLMLVTSCASNSAMPAETVGKLPVVASFSILGDWVQQVAGNNVTLVTLVGAGNDAHTFEPSPTDSVKLVRATLIFEIGVGFESWLDDLYAASNASARRVTVSDGVEMRKLIEITAYQDEFDPHLWHDVQNAMQAVAQIRDALSKVDPQNAANYQANAQNYLAQLQELDAWIEQEVAKIPAKQRKLVTTHDTFGYFAARYGFEITGSALASASTEAADPAAIDMVRLIERIKAEGVPAIFAENVSNPALIAQIASEAGVTLAPPLYSDALGDLGSAGDSYLKMMRYNVTTIVSALSHLP